MKSVLFASAVVLSSLHAQGKVKTASPVLTVSDARIFAPLKGTNATAGYATITNTTDKEIKVTLEKAAPFKAVELHQTVEKEGRMAMEKLTELSIPANGSVELKPGGNHIMLFDASRPVKEKEVIKVLFKVDGKTQELSFKVVPRVGVPEHAHH